MTRGKFHLIESQERYAVLHQSCEFNGDMYPGGHYEKAVQLLQTVEYPVDFYKMTLQFDKEEDFNYQDAKDGYFKFYRHVLFSRYRKGLDGEEIEKIEEPYVSFKEGILTIDLNKDYFEYWFSDYIFFKIVGDKPIRFIADKDEKENPEIIVNPGEVITFHYGYKPKVYEPGEEVKAE